MASSSMGDVARKPGHFLDELRATFADRANRPAIVYQSRSWTYGELDEKARRCAARLRQLGVGRGDRVAIATAEKLPFLAAHLGALHAAAVSLPLSPSLAGDELRFFLRESGARVVVAGSDVHSIVHALRADLPGLRSLMLDSEAWEAPGATFSDPAIDRNAACVIFYSSSSTGQPRGVVHTHASLASGLRTLRAAWQFNPDDTMVNVLPLFQIHGLSLGAHLSLLTGSCMQIEELFHPRRTLEIVGRGTVFMGLPTFYYTFLDEPEFREIARGWSHVRLFACVSSAIRTEVLPGLESILRRPVIVPYAMTEAHVVASPTPDGSGPRGSVGKPLDGVEVRVIDDDGRPARTGAVGSVQVRGPNLFRDYWRDPDATRVAFASGWFDTSDRGSFDEDGFLTLAGLHLG
ncbi:MAG: class I adenylate-forming enzyme family protein [Isosphaeraceae bacterium]